MERTFLTERGERLAFRTDHRDRLGVGGQGQVFRTSLGGSTVAVKLIRQPDERRLRALMALEPTCGSSATLPCRLVYADADGSPGALLGYAMRCLDPATSLPLVRLFNFEEIARLSRFSWRDAVLAALRLAEAVAELHRCGVVIGDLNCENVIFCRDDPDREGNSSWRAVVLDSDSFQLEASGGQRFCCPVSRAPTTAPELLGADLATTWRTPSSDNFALAVLIHQILLHDHPYDNAIYAPNPDLSLQERIGRGLYPHRAIPIEGLSASPYRPAPHQISPAIDGAFRRSFHPTRDHLCCGLRPSAASWVALLRELHGQIVPCDHDRHHHRPEGMPCPWCAVDEAAGQPISLFPTGPHNTHRPDPTQQPGPPSGSWPPEWRTQLQPLEARLRRGLALRQNHGDLVDRLLGLSHSIEGVHSSHGDAARLLDRDAVLAGLRPPRRSWRQRLLRRPAPADPAQELVPLIRGAEAIARGVSSTVAGLQHELRRLLDALAAVDLTAVDGCLPVASASNLLQRQVALQQQTWLRQQLQAIPLRTLAAGSVADGRLSILEANGIGDGLALQSRLERIICIYGIGAVTRDRLRQRLVSVKDELRRRHSGTVTTAALQSWLRSSGLDALPAIEPLEEQLTRLQHHVTILEQRFGDLRDALPPQLDEHARQVKALQERFR